jgi:G3E family GTPase
MADPAPVVQTFFVDKRVEPFYELDCVVTVVDAMQIITRLEEEQADGMKRKEAVEQLAFADKIVLNKIDLVTDSSVLERIEDRIREINCVATIVRCKYSHVDPESLLGVKAFTIDRVLTHEPDFLSERPQFIKDHKHDERVSSFSFWEYSEIDVAKLNDWIGSVIKEKGADLYRYKGVLAVRGHTEKYVFQGVGPQFAGSFSPQPIWSAGEKRQSRFCFIGKHLDWDALRVGFSTCRVEGRFRIGDQVLLEGAPNEYLPGRVVDMWQNGCMYQVQLDSYGGDAYFDIEDDDDPQLRAYQS